MYMYMYMYIDCISKIPDHQEDVSSRSVGKGCGHIIPEGPCHIYIYITACIYIYIKLLHIYIFIYCCKYVYIYIIDIYALLRETC